MEYLTHLTALQQTVQKHPDNVAFKIPSGDHSQSSWKDVSYKVFWDDITRMALRWLNKLSPKVDSTSREVVGVWMGGRTYVETVNLFSLQRANYVPHLVSTYVEDANLVRSLFEESGAKVVVCDVNDVKEWEQLRKHFDVIPFLGLDGPPSTSTLDISRPLPALDGKADDILSIGQSSGSSSGRPKLVPCTRRWLDANAQKLTIDGQRTPVIIRNGAICSAPQLSRFLRSFFHGDCTVLTPKLVWQPDELAGIISECGVTNISLYASLVGDIIHKARNSPNLREKLRTLDSLAYGGGPLDERSLEWAKEMNIPISATFGATEVGAMMFSTPDTPHLFKVYPQLDHEFVPIPGADPDSKVRELVILPTSPDCPPPVLRNPNDGKYYTKDLFERAESSEAGTEKLYIPRGRKDDIIVMEEASNCDARYLEERVAFLCHDLISILVVVGQGRPSPALLVEPLAGSPDNIEINGHGQTSLRSLIASRLKPLTSSKDGSTLYPHERIKPEYIVVLPKGSLPVSSFKGAVIRRKAEEKFKELLDKLYAGDSVWNADY